MMYVRFPLSLRNIEDRLHERDIDICHETVGFWWNRFGPMFARKIRNRRVHHHAYSNWRWHLDEVFVRINGVSHYLWWTVDHEGEVLETFVTERRDRRAVLVFLKKAMKRYGLAKVIVTDRLKLYRTAMAVIGNQVGQWKNNRAENSDLPFRRRERAMSRFRLKRSLQKFTSVHSSVCNHFNIQKHLISKDEFKVHRHAALVGW
jgi:putative transposase